MSKLLTSTLFISVSASNVVVAVITALVVLPYRSFVSYRECGRAVIGGFGKNYAAYIQTKRQSVQRDTYATGKTKTLLRT